MRAVIQDSFGGSEVLRIQDMPRPAPAPTEVLVRVHAAGVNPVDWQTRAGGGMAGVLGEPPFILGWDVSGVVEQTGFGVTTLKTGDAVYGMPRFPRAAGGYAEFVTGPSRQFARKPASTDHEHAAAVPMAALTAWQALVDTADAQAGQRVLIHAAAGGGSGTSPSSSPNISAHTSSEPPVSSTTIGSASSALTKSWTTPPPRSRKPSKTSTSSSTWWETLTTRPAHDHLTSFGPAVCSSLSPVVFPPSSAPPPKLEACARRHLRLNLTARLSFRSPDSSTPAR